MFKKLVSEPNLLLAALRQALRREFLWFSRFLCGIVRRGKREKEPLTRILVIEDHKKLLNSLDRGLTTAGYEVIAADTGEAGFYYAST